MLRKLLHSTIKTAVILSLVTDFTAGAFFPSLSPDSDIVVIVETGDRQNAGTNDDVYIRLFDDSGNESDEITLNNMFKNDFRRGQRDSFFVLPSNVGTMDLNGQITSIELWKDGSDDWYVDKVIVENSDTENSYVFPVFRWMKDGNHYKFVEYDTTLPQDDPFKEQREMELQNKRLSYVYAQLAPGDSPVQAATLPDGEELSLGIQFGRGSKAASLFAASQVIMSTQDEWTCVNDIRSIYSESIIQTPRGIDQWNSDLYFGLKRVASMNPALVERVTAIPANFPVTDELLENLLDGMTIAEAIADNRLFMVDFKILDNAITKEGNVLCAPIGLFFLNKLSQLKPVAIQLFQKDGPDNPIFTPENPELTWELVKMWFNNADAQVHEAITHLGMTHLLMEGIVVATHRNLSPSHPIFKMLAPHFLYIIANNKVAIDPSFEEGGLVDTSFSVGAAGFIDLFNQAIQTWRMDVNGNFRADLLRRGLDDPDVLPVYHYRNDALAYLEAIEKYTKNYVDHYYSTDDILKADTEIQSWVQDMVLERNGAEGGLGLLGVPGNGALTETGQLTEILSSIIFTVTVAHAVINFPQHEEYGFPINYPLILRGTPPTDPAFVATEQDILDAAPDMATTLALATFSSIATTRDTNSLGDFEVQYVCDPPAVAIVDEFRSDIAAIGEEIKTRNLDNRIPAFEYLLLENIPNSIAI